VGGKRRLPLVQAAPEGEGDDGEARRPWQWVGFGAAAAFVTWLPLTALAWAVAQRWGAAGQGEEGLALAAAKLVATFAVALAIGSLAGGFVVGRWGPQQVGVREAAFAGLAAAIAAIAVAGASFGFSPGYVLVVVVAVPFAAIGGWRGRRRRARVP
jgi:peptidoglycan/LPS O-acetylase OafA/YrhL